MATVLPKLTGIQIEGGLIAPDMADQLLQEEEELDGQAPTDFGLNQDDNLTDTIAAAWGAAKAYWAAFQQRWERSAQGDTATSLTRNYWAIPVLELLGYQPEYQAKAAIVDGKTYAISHWAEPGEEKPPIHIVGCGANLEERPPTGTPRLSAHGLVQEYLNRTEHLWAIATNGLRWRLLRDSSLMTRLSFIEFDLEQILNGENFAEFQLFFRLFHRTRLPDGAEDADYCLLEFYHQEARQQGNRIRYQLRKEVEQALCTLGNGFLKHSQNAELRQRVSSGEFDGNTYYRQLLLLIYRLLFLMVAESRNLLLADSDPKQAPIYRECYSIERLRLLAERPDYQQDSFQDLWQGLRVTFRLFDENWRGQLLGLSPLNGNLFNTESLATFDDCALDNKDLLDAIRQLSLYEQRGQLRRINYAALDVEELGSIYESLLDFSPQIANRQGIYSFDLVAGGDRKSTGSYYTPPELVSQFIESTLDPVIENRLQGVQTRERQERALLSLTVCDPACGSGHFLLAAARRIGEKLAKIRTGEAYPPPQPTRKAIREAIQNCVYGVDLNPLAVDLCKVALWLEGVCKGYPLTFLDHRIKCGNSLVGVLDLNCLHEGIPEKAYKAVTGDDKEVAKQVGKRNKKQLKELQKHQSGQLALDFERLASARESYTEAFCEVGAIAETTTTDYRQKQQQYERSRQDPHWWRDRTACDLWTAAFFMPLTEKNLQLIPTTDALQRWLQCQDSALAEVVEAASKLGEEQKFFHWPLEFPDVFKSGGFDCVIGNPPWEKIKLQEKEFFASRDFDIANAPTSAERKKLIEQLPSKYPSLHHEWEEVKQLADAQGQFMRESGRYQLTSKGDINTYAVFAETDRKLVSNKGRSGIVVPTGIATDNSCKDFFGSLIESCNLVSLYDFENRRAIFPDVHRSYKFSLLITAKDTIQKVDFAFFLTAPRQVNDPECVFKLSPQDITLINPNTSTCPVFRTSADAELTKKIYEHVPVLENERLGKDPWQVTFMAMFHMSNDSSLFVNKYQREENIVPLYEAKMLHQYDYRWATYEDGNIRGVTLSEKRDPNYRVTPRYWIDKAEVENRLAGRWNKKWLLAFRDICRSTDERTAIFSLLPKIALGNNAPLLSVENKSPPLLCCLVANLDCLVFDFVARQKIGGTHMNFFILKQLPVIPPHNYTNEDINYISSRVLELTYTSWEMKPFAEDMGYEGEPFIWDEGRRAKLRAELDAYYAKLYGLTRDELRYILDPKAVHGEDFPSESFRVLKENEIKKYGEYRTQRLVLAAWDMLNA